LEKLHVFVLKICSSLHFIILKKINSKSSDGNYYISYFHVNSYCMENRKHTIIRYLSYSYLPTLPFCAGISRTNDKIPEISHLPVRSRTGVWNLPHSDILTRNDPHSYFSGFFIAVNRSKQRMGDHLKTFASSLHVLFISNRKSFLSCQLQQERGLWLDQAAV
jgi:hypothetical protein